MSTRRSRLHQPPASRSGPEGTRRGTVDGAPARLHLAPASGKGLGVFALEPFARGERVLVFGGPRLHRDEVPDFSRAIQAGPDLFLGPSGRIDDYVNHSCAPSTGVHQEGDRLALVALRPIAPGEEISFDYSTCMVDEPALSTCRCGAEGCRGRIGPFAELDPERRRHYLELGVVPAFVRASVGDGGD